MITLIEDTDISATYQFSHNHATRMVAYPKVENAELPLEQLVEAEHGAWLQWLGANTEN